MGTIRSSEINATNMQREKTESYLYLRGGGNLKGGEKVIELSPIGKLQSLATVATK